jgi:hypothetical protein
VGGRKQALEFLGLSRFGGKIAIKRRDFLKGRAVAGASSLIQPKAESGQEIAPRPKYHYSKPVIDAHFHWYPPEFTDLIEREGAANGVTNIRRNENGELECVVPGNHRYASHAVFRRDMTDVNLILKAMDGRHLPCLDLLVSWILHPEPSAVAWQNNPPVRDVH